MYTNGHFILMSGNHPITGHLSNERGSKLTIHGVSEAGELVDATFVSGVHSDDTPEPEPCPVTGHVKTSEDGFDVTFTVIFKAHGSQTTWTGHVPKADHYGPGWSFTLPYCYTPKDAEAWEGTEPKRFPTRGEDTFTKQKEVRE